MVVGSLVMKKLKVKSDLVVDAGELQDLVDSTGGE
jgi:hypothetical protein